jgi:hydrogenase maturation protease
MKKTLLIGIGNAGREDDGLGWAFLEQVEQEVFFEGDRLYRFQLNLEDAELISRYEMVLFIDAYKGELENGFLVSRCLPCAGAGFSTHLLPPESTLYLCLKLYGCQPQAWTLAIQGYHWEIKEGVSPQAQVNLRRALSWFKEKSNKLQDTTF